MVDQTKGIFEGPVPEGSDLEKFRTSGETEITFTPASGPLAGGRSQSLDAGDAPSTTPKATAPKTPEPTPTPRTEPTLQEQVAKQSFIDPQTGAPRNFTQDPVLSLASSPDVTPRAIRRRNIEQSAEDFITRARNTDLAAINVLSDTLELGVKSFGVQDISRKDEDFIPKIEVDDPIRSQDIASRETLIGGGVLLVGGARPSAGGLRGIRQGIQSLAEATAVIRPQPGRFIPSFRQEEFTPTIVNQEPIPQTDFLLEASSSIVKLPEGDILAGISRGGLGRRSDGKTVGKGIEIIERRVLDVDPLGRPSLNIQRDIDPFVGASIDFGKGIGIGGVSTPKGTSTSITRSQRLGRSGDTDIFGAESGVLEAQIRDFSSDFSDITFARGGFRSDAGTQILGFRTQPPKQPSTRTKGRTTTSLDQSFRFDSFTEAGLTRDLPKVSQAQSPKTTPLVKPRDLPSQITSPKTNNVLTGTGLDSPQAIAPPIPKLDDALGDLSQDLSRQRTSPLLGTKGRQSPLDLQIVEQIPDLLQPQIPKQPTPTLLFDVPQSPKRQQFFFDFGRGRSQARRLLPGLGGFFPGGSLKQTRRPRRKGKRKLRRTPSLISLPSQLDIRVPNVQAGEETGLIPRGVVSRKRKRKKNSIVDLLS